MTMVSMIVAAAEDHAIGKRNEMLWHLPDDFKFFKETTMGHPVVMGRKTFQSLGRPLPKRPNIVISRQEGFVAEGAQVVSSLSDALQLAKTLTNTEIMVIGGGEIYKQALPLADKVYLTRVHARFPDADAHFPVLNKNEWQLTQSTLHPIDEKHAHAFTFEVWERKV